mgnify:CR=1 FL=1
MCDQQGRERAPAAGALRRGARTAAQGPGNPDRQLVLYWVNSRGDRRGLRDLPAARTVSFNGGKNVLKVRRYADLGAALKLSNFPAVNENEFGFVWDGPGHADPKFWLIYNAGPNKWKWEGSQVTE